MQLSLVFPIKEILGYCWVCGCNVQVVLFYKLKSGTAKFHWVFVRVICQFQHTLMGDADCHCVGVKPERLAEGMNPRHCALSLVGEPIMYPEINTLVNELHNRRISTFLVTNAQFPERITNLAPITQVILSEFFCVIPNFHIHVLAVVISMEASSTSG